jgi:asparagine synthase (glutamine-hydrolysing)
MFALGLWDESAQTLTLARDRYGKKPLYYGKVGTDWVFASELKALHQKGMEVDRQALNGYLRAGFVEAPASIYRGIFKLPPASWVILGTQTHSPTPRPYWSLARLRQQNPLSLTFQQALEELESRLSEAVRLRMVADVPLGAFLSGGIDSSLIVALMQKLANQPIRTFCIGFQEASHDESPFARQVADALGCRHTERRLTAQETLDVIPMLPQMFDEPLGDPSQIPTYLVSKLARSEVTVALSGDGGDEVFGGYNRYLWGPKVWNNLRRIPLGLRRALAKILSHLPARQLAKLLPQVSYPEEKMTKLLQVLRVANPSELYQQLLWAWDEDLVEGIHQDFIRLPSGDFASAMMEHDALTYLPDDIMVKVDRASMAVSLECRAPFLDLEVAEFAWRVPLQHKVQDRQGKLLLRSLLYKYLPPHLFERPKAGFSLPLGEWLRGPLRDWAESLLDENLLRQQGYLKSTSIRKRWNQHLTGHRNWSASLWQVLQFQAWLRAWT